MFLCSWDFPGKNTGVGYHFLPQGIFPTQGPESPSLPGRFFTTEPLKVNIAQSLLTLCDPLDCPWNSLGQNTGVGSLFQGGLPNPGIEPRSPTLQADSLPAEPQGKPKKTGVGSLSLPQGFFLTQESNQGLAHCRQILYQLSYQGSPREASKRRKRVQNRTG